MNIREIIIPAGRVQIGVHAETLEDYEQIAAVARRGDHVEGRLDLAGSVRGLYSFRRIKYEDQGCDFVIFDPTMYPLAVKA